MIILGEDGLRSQYVPPKPMVKILKRPTADSRGSGDGPLNDEKPKQPIKSLKQVCNLGCLPARDTWWIISLLHYTKGALVRDIQCTIIQ